mmetsp:Transcript_52265/g.131212  ORF Transcript_52265/g.131212 Transcript_52265/m.131212 type:complete len:432 (-) Transcript_52265:172-1467(-)|eukprot:CAMPEP_0177631678 /NCGR_PEP_ID=MMETSP0447-20121125/1877_1 /TAXON_ID=0 /ORGANISM="Stygamoeba regulata, Strain BSH-02190019" /LENGTH=431 /DNA_ID=CAMNT_0019133177 /DNA_START=127 /DNA_END=1422 /DNA_ORIENTATION=-
MLPVPLILTVVCAVCVAWAGHAPPVTEGVAQTPPMGWNTWGQYRCNINETLIQNAAAALVSSGLAKAGYVYVNIDDCWAEKERDSNGRLVPSRERFPSGLRVLSDQLHARGLRLGIYSDVGHRTCQGYPGSYGAFATDAQTFAEWGIDYLKLDYCHTTISEKVDPAPFYADMAAALKQTGRPIVFSVCNWGDREPWKWAPEFANMWRIYGDLWPSWERVMEAVTRNTDLADYAKPGKWNDPDMLMVGVQGHFFNWPGMPATNLTLRESRTQFSLWAIFASPLLASNNLLAMPSEVLAILSNSEVIRVNQDTAGVQGRLVAEVRTGAGMPLLCAQSVCRWTQVFTRPLADGSFAAVLFNRAGRWSQADTRFRAEDIVLPWAALGVPEATSFSVRDLWTHSDVGVFSGEFKAAGVQPHGAVMVRLTPMQPPRT